MRICLLILGSLFGTTAGFLVPCPYDARSCFELAGYVPDGMSPEQYRKLKAKENEMNRKKDFGAFGPQSFKSRSLLSFQKDLEQGKANHLMPVFNSKEKLKKGIIKEADIPYMQRLGSWDNSDLGKRKQWNKIDQRYNQNERPQAVDWMGRNQSTGPNAPRKGEPTKNPSQKKLFGFF